MPSGDWFKENPKVSAYISQELYEKLEDWMNDQNIRKVSQALTLILEQHLKANQISPMLQDSDVNRRIEVLEGK